MADTFNDYISVLIAKEGGSTLTNDPHDHGGVTKWGITERVARDHGYTGDMAQMTEDYARSLYETTYWRVPRLDQLNTVVPELARYLLDIGVNMGPLRAVTFLQCALSALMPQAALRLDGRVGPQTIDTLRQFLAKRGEVPATHVLMTMIKAQAVTYYMDLVAREPTQSVYEYGWITRTMLEGQ